jgi:hypothetical protein
MINPSWNSYWDWPNNKCFRKNCVRRRLWTQDLLEATTAVFHHLAMLWFVTITSGPPITSFSSALWGNTLVLENLKIIFFISFSWFDACICVINSICIACYRRSKCVCIYVSVCLEKRSYNVTTLTEIIPSYRLNHSIWSLSDNKESSRWVLPGLRPVNHLKTQRGSNVCIKLPWRRVQSAL